MTELLFENLKEKPNIFVEKLEKLRINNNISNNYPVIRRFSLNSLNFKKNVKKPKTRNKYSVELRNSYVNRLIRYSSVSLKKSAIINNENNTNNNNNNNDCNNSNYSNNNNNNNNNNGISKKRIQKKPSKFYPQNKKANCNVQINTSNQNLIIKENIFKGNINPLKTKKFENPMSPKKKFIRQLLFPYKYYLCSIFIRNLDTTNKVYFISSRFARVYTFLCQLFDITTYFCLLREFNALKKIFNEKSLHLIERNKKININANSFIKDINNCIGEHKLYILAQGINT